MLVRGLILSLLMTGSALADSAMPTVGSMANRLLAANAKPDAIASAFYSDELKSFTKHVTDPHWRDFDAEPLIGVQDWGGMTIGSMSEQTGRPDRDSTVRVDYVMTYEGKTSHHIVNYVMVKEKGRWKIDDMIYSEPTMSFRYMMTRTVDPE